MSRIKSAITECTICTEYGTDPNCEQCKGTGFEWLIRVECAYCLNYKFGRGWHDCPQAVRARDILDKAIQDIHDLMERPGVGPLTSHQMAHRAEHLRSIATSVKLRGGNARPEYER